MVSSVFRWFSHYKITWNLLQRFVIETSFIDADLNNGTTVEYRFISTESRKLQNKSEKSTLQLADILASLREVVGGGGWGRGGGEVARKLYDAT